ncbi:MAG: Branched-chain amino acid transporter permease [Thermoproteota archaeon]|nr:Branched-chain amino acid transporter permease [Thermoproteota archaeon]
MLDSTGLFVLNLLASLAPFLIVTVSLNLEYGYAGIPNFGKTLAVAGGAFVAGVIPGRFLAFLFGIGKNLSYIDDNKQIVSAINRQLVTDPVLSIGIIILTLIMAVLIGALLGLLIAYPVARLRTDYLGMTFLAFGQVILVIGNNFPPLVGGTLGVSVPDPFAFVSVYSIFDLLPGEMRNLFVITFMSIVALLVFLFARRLTRSPLGRVLRAIRDDENSALALGKDVQRNRIIIMIFSSAIAALAGALYAMYTANVFSTTYSRTTWTFWPWVMVILGGAANDLGIVSGTFIFVAVRQIISYYREFFEPILPFNIVWLDTLLLGLALLFILIYRPEGLIREKPIKTIKIESLSVEESKKASIKQTSGFREELKKIIETLLKLPKKKETEEI